MCVTGVFLAYQRQITNWADGDWHSTPPTPGSVRLPIEAMVAEVSARHSALPSAITLHSDTMAPAEVSYGREHLVLVDVYTGRILGEASPRTRAFFQSIENWHR
jgi:uncharacterized iron-regulated membrane protein